MEPRTASEGDAGDQASPPPAAIASLGKIYAFSGLDCAGKSTQIQLLTARLKQEGKRPHYLWVRGGYTPLFTAAKKWLRKLSGGRALPPSGRSAAREELLVRSGTGRLWLSIAIIDLMLVYGVYVRLCRIVGRDVVCDRFLWDTAIDFRLNFPEEEVERWTLWRLAEWLTPRPDVSFLLLIPVEESMRRSKLKSEPFPDSAETLAKRLSDYREIGSRRKVTIIDATRPVNEVAAEIHAAVFGARAGN